MRKHTKKVIATKCLAEFNINTIQSNATDEAHMTIDINTIDKKNSTNTSKSFNVKKYAHDKLKKTINMIPNFNNIKYDSSSDWMGLILTMYKNENNEQLEYIDNSECIIDKIKKTWLKLFNK